MTAEGRLTPECRDSLPPSFLPPVLLSHPALFVLLFSRSLRDPLMAPHQRRGSSTAALSPGPVGFFFSLTFFFFFSSPLIGMSMATQQRASVCAVPLLTKRAFSESKSRAAHLILSKIASHLLQRQNYGDFVCFTSTKPGGKCRGVIVSEAGSRSAIAPMERASLENASSFQLCSLHPHEAPAGGSCLSHLPINCSSSLHLAPVSRECQ